MHACFTINCRLHLWQNGRVFYTLLRKHGGEADTEIRVSPEDYTRDPLSISSILSGLLLVGPTHRPVCQSNALPTKPLGKRCTKQHSRESCWIGSRSNILEKAVGFGSRRDTSEENLLDLQKH